MSADELFAIVNPWYNAGSLPDHQKPVVQAFYTELTGDTGERCRTCSSYWSDVLHELRIHLATFGYRVMDLKTKKYIIRKDAGYLQVHGLPYVYINKGSGPESESAKYLTDPIAEKLLTEKPDRAEIIVLNPEYEEPTKASGATAKAAGTKASQTKTAAAKGGKKGAKSTKDAAPSATDSESTVTPPTDPANADQQSGLSASIHTNNDSSSDSEEQDDDADDDDSNIDDDSDVDIDGDGLEEDDESEDSDNND